MINKFSFTIFHWQGFLVHVDDQQVSLDKFRALKVNNILVTFSLLSVYTSKFLTWQFFLVKEKLARQIFLSFPFLCPLFPIYTSNFSKSRQTCEGKIGRVNGALPFVQIFYRKNNRSARAARIQLADTSAVLHMATWNHQIWIFFNVAMQQKICHPLFSLWNHS